MLRQAFHEFTLATRGRGLYEFTGEIAAWLAKNNFQNGLLTLHLRHTSASLLIQENADPDGRPIFVHTSEGDDDMPAHIRTALTSVNLSIPFHEGRLALGTWQRIYVWEHRRVRHTRKIAAHFIGD